MGWLGRADANVIAVADAVAGLGRLAVDLDAVGLDDAMDRRAAVIGELAGQELIQADTVEPKLGDDLHYPVVAVHDGRGHGGERGALYRMQVQASGGLNARRVAAPPG